VAIDSSLGNRESHPSPFTLPPFRIKFPSCTEPWELLKVNFFRCGCGSMVERGLPKPETRVRFPSPAPPSFIYFDVNLRHKCVHIVRLFSRSSYRKTLAPKPPRPGLLQIRDPFGSPSLRSMRREIWCRSGMGWIVFLLHSVALIAAAVFYSHCETRKNSAWVTYRVSNLVQHESHPRPSRLIQTDRNGLSRGDFWV
jgi:hypothetical protein